MSSSFSGRTRRGRINPLSFNTSKSKTRRPMPFQQEKHFSPIRSDEETYFDHMDHPPTSYHADQPQFEQPREFSSSPAAPTFEQPREFGASSTSLPPKLDNNARLDRIEAMLEKLISKGYEAEEHQTPTTTVNEELITYRLEPSRHDFTTSMWLDKIHEMSVMNQWNEKTTLKFMENQMNGVIKGWYDTLSHCNYSWNEWRMLINKTFPDNDEFVTTLKRLVTRIKQGSESIVNYYFSKMYLLKACKIAGTDAVSCLIDGLNNEAIMAEAKLRNYLTPERLYSHYLINLSEYEIDYQPPEETGSFDLPKQDFNGGQQPEFQPPDPQDFFSNFDTIAVNEGGPDFQTRGNANNYKRKHFGRRNPRGNNTFNQRICTVCFKKGHVAAFCRKAMSICRSTETCNSCYQVDCKVNSKNLTALIDTGCTTVVLRKKEAQELNLTWKPCNDYLTGYSGNRVKILGEVVIDLEVDEVKNRLSVCVAPDHLQDVPLIIGQSFINRPNCMMVVANNQLRMIDDRAKNNGL